MTVNVIRIIVIIFVLMAMAIMGAALVRAVECNAIPFYERTGFEAGCYLGNVAD